MNHRSGDNLKGQTLLLQNFKKMNGRPASPVEDSIKLEEKNIQLVKQKSK